MKIKLYTLALCVGLSMTVYAQKPAKKTITVPMANTDTPPVMDGILDPSEGWNLSQKVENRIDLTQQACDGGPQGPASNNTVTFGAQWDADHLYIAVKVIDDKATPKDLIEIFLGMGAKDKTGCPSSDGTWPKLYNSTDFQLQLYHDGKGWSSPQDAQSMVDAFTLKDYADGYILEVALLWSEMQFFLTTPPPVESGYKILWDLGASDCDVVGADRTSVLMWSQGYGNRNWSDNTDFGNLILSADPATGVNDMKNIVSSVSLVPNPSNGADVNLNIESLQAQTVNVSVMNVMSQTLSSSTQNINTGSNTIQLNTSGLSNGMYWVSISNGKSSLAKKLVMSK